MGFDWFGEDDEVQPATPPAPPNQSDIPPADAHVLINRLASTALQGPGAAANVYFLIFGMKGTGKTTLLRRLYAARVTRGGRGTFIDRTGRNGNLAQLTPGGAIVRSPAAWYATVRAALQQGRPFNIIVQPRRGVSISPLFAMMYEVGKMLAAIDEAESYMSAAHMDPEAAELVSLGRNQLIDIVATVRVPPELNRRLRGNADIVASFRQPSKYYADELNKEHFHLAGGTELLMSLQPFTYIRAENGIVTRGQVAA